MPALNNDIFSIENIAHENGTVKATLGINVQSEVFKGHFPGQPVLPGACMLQVVKDILEIVLNSTFQLKKADHLKFTSMIVPSINDMVQLELSYKTLDNSMIVTAKLFASDVVCFKFQGSFIKG